MFFSIIIPTYNPKKYISKLLDSISTNDCVNDIEVIIADDKSEENIEAIIKKYDKNLNIRLIENTKHFGAPMKGRQNGAEIALGEWIIFADQDDYFIDGSFDNVKNFIDENNVINYLVTNFYEKTIDEQFIEHNNVLNWTHGKFYQKKFWVDYKLKYNNTHYCEDIGLSVLTQCILNENKLPSFYFDEYTYVWVQHLDSLSKMNGYTNKSYFYKSFNDYIRITLGCYIERFQKINVSDDAFSFYIESITSMIVHLYFYIQGMIFQNDDFEKDISEYTKITSEYLIKFLKLIKWDYNYFIRFVYNSMDMYSEVRNVCYSQIPFIELETFEDWIKKLIKEYEEVQNNGTKQSTNRKRRIFSTLRFFTKPGR